MPTTPATTPRSSSPSEAAPPSPAKVRVRIGIAGEPGAGKTTLLTASTKLATLPADVALEPAGAALDIDGLLYVIEANQDAARLEEQLERIVEQLQHWTATRGASCSAGAWPIYLVLTKCDTLVPATASLGAWMERIEAAKLRVHEGLQAMLPASEREGQGFGSAAVHVWAIALRRPAGAAMPNRPQEPFGLIELLRQVTDEARGYARRRDWQAARLQTVVWSLAAVLAILVLTAAVGVVVRGLTDSSALPADRGRPARIPSPLALQGPELLAQGERLLRFEGYRPGSPPSPPRTQWPRWFQDAESWLRQSAALRGQAAVRETESDLRRRLDRVEDALQHLGQQAALFRLAGTVAGRPALLEIPLDLTLERIPARLAQLRESYPDFRPRPLPDEVPLGVAQELRAAALANYQNLLEPARLLVAKQLSDSKNGGRASLAGNESAKAWIQLAEGWLATKADQELGPWRELAMLLLRLAQAEEPPDPLARLNSFLRQERFHLPLGSVTLELPGTVSADGQSVTGLRPVGPLVIRARAAPDRTETIILSPVAQTNVRDAREGRWVFRGEASGRLVFVPGTAISASVPLVDSQGRQWRLSWPTSESPSSVYTFAVLTLAPRLHPESQTDPIRGTPVFAARLVLPDASAFALPDLFPR